MSGGNDRKETPVPIPNTEVKLPSADDTWTATSRESRSLPDLFRHPVVICHRVALLFAEKKRLMSAAS